MFLLWRSSSGAAEVRLSPTLTFFDLAITCAGLKALSVFPLAKEAPVSLRISYSVALKPPFHILNAWCVPAFFVKRSPFWKLSTGLGSTNKSSTFLPFSFQTLALFFPHFSLLRTSTISLFEVGLAGTIFFLLHQRVKWTTGYSFLSGNDMADELLCSSHLQFHVVSLLLSVVPTLVGLEAY